jgi:hypothetical protein
MQLNNFKNSRNLLSRRIDLHFCRDRQLSGLASLVAL